MSKLILVRHASTQIDPEIHPRQWNLSHEGKLQSIALVNSIDNLHTEISRLHCSSEPKTSQTLGPLIKELDLLPYTDYRFDEFHLPYYEEKTDIWLELKREQLIKPDYNNDRETSLRVLNRFVEGVSELDQSLNHLICTHGTVLSLFMAKLRGYLWTDAVFDYWKRLKFTSIEVIDFNLLELV